jgi:hypothetical protein
VNLEGIVEVVGDKGYHSGAALVRMKESGVRTYIPEKKQAGKRHWIGKKDEQQAVYANRQRVSGNYGKSLLRKRGELIERSFAHCYDTGTSIKNCSFRPRHAISRFSCALCMERASPEPPMIGSPRLFLRFWPLSAP